MSTGIWRDGDIAISAPRHFFSSADDKVPPDEGLARIATIIPLYGQSQFLVNAVASVVESDTSLAVIVNDGCPDTASDILPRAFRNCFRDRLIYLRKANGGLSSARNCGIKYVLKHHPEVEALFFLDADNFVGPGFFNIVSDALRKNKETDWLYFPLRIFGSSNEDWYMSPYFNKYRQYFENQCDAGSVVRRRVFEQGLLFDETMRHGYEDWEFFLRLVEHGFKGERDCEASFYYRKKRESMLTVAKTKHSMLVDEIYLRHLESIEPRQLTAIEHETAPRFLAIDIQDGEWAAFTDPGAITWMRGTKPDWALAPIAIFTNKAALAFLSETCVLHSALLSLQVAVRSNFVKLSIQASDHFELVPRALTDKFFLWAGSAHALANPERIGQGIDTAIRHSNVLCFQLPGIKAIPEASHISTEELVTAVHSTSESLRLPPDCTRQNDSTPLQHFLWHKHVHKFETTYPLITRSRLHLVFFLPWLRLGGVELCVMNIARAMKTARPDIFLHLVLTQENAATLPPGDELLFDEITPLGHVDWETRLRACDAIIACADLAINAHSEAAYASLDLRQARAKRLRFGRPVSYLHVIDKTKLGKPCGYPFEAASRDAMLHGHVVISEHLRQFLINHGVAPSRINVARNAPVFLPPSLEDAYRLAVKKAQAAIGPARPLNILFAGRLDHQKGLSRLRALITLSQQMGQNAKFNIVGSEVLDGTNIDWPTESCHRFPATNDPIELSKFYREADVFVLLSHWEGVPLSILDAMAHGAIVIATDVGAVAEVVAHEVNGFLIQDGEDLEIAESAAQVLAALARDSKGAIEMRRAAVKTAHDHTWRNTAMAFLEILDQSQVSGTTSS